MFPSFLQHVLLPVPYMHEKFHHFNDLTQMSCIIERFIQPLYRQLTISKEECMFPVLQESQQQQHHCSEAYIWETGTAGSTRRIMNIRYLGTRCCLPLTRSSTKHIKPTKQLCAPWPVRSPMTRNRQVSRITYPHPPLHVITPTLTLCLHY